MALDPRTLTPAAAKSLFLQQTAPRVGFPQNTSGMSMPQIDAGRGMSLGMFPETTQNQLLSDEAAKDVGQQIFGPRLDNADPDKLMTMATDDNNKVDPSVQDIHNENPEIAKILGAVVKLQNDTSSTQLLKSLVGEKATPEAAKAEVQKFFDLKKDDEVPVWADVALTIGLDLLDPKTSTGSFLGDIGGAGKKGLAVGKARGKEARARSDMMDKLAFGIFREDEKSRKTLGVQLAGQLAKQKTDSLSLAMDLAKFFQAEEKISDAEAKARSTAITSSINTLTSDQKEKALPIIARFPNAFKGVSVDQVPSTFYALLKNNGLRLDNISDASNIVESTFTISDEATYNRYKTAFPTAFPEAFVVGKEYKVQGFSDKSKPATELAMTNVLSVDKSIGGQDELSRQFTARAELITARNAITNTDSDEYKRIVNELNEVEGRIDILSERKSPQSYVFVEGRMVAAGEGAAGAFTAADAASKAVTLSKQGDSLAAAFGLGDNILRSLSNTPAPADSVGVVAQFGKFIGGAKGQLDAVTGAFGERASDNAGNYASGVITPSMLGSTERIGNTTVGKVFTNLQSLAQGNAEVQSQLMSFAYALAGSRETGKLTDKDVAAALVTFGGGDIAEGKWFANADMLITGINQALDTATNAYAISFDSVHQSPANIKYLRDVEKLSDDEIANKTKFNLPSFLKNNEGIRTGLADRVGLVNGRIKFQSVDAYRGDGAGNVDGQPTYSARELSFIDVLNDAARRSQLDPSDPSYITPDQLDVIINTVPADILDKFKQQATP